MSNIIQSVCLATFVLLKGFKSIMPQVDITICVMCVHQLKIRDYSLKVSKILEI